MRPDAVAIISGETKLSYQQLHDLSAHLALYLREMGVARGDVVALLAPRGVPAVVAMLASLSLGAAYAPIDPNGPPEFVAATLARCDPAAVLHDGAGGFEGRGLALGPLLEGFAGAPEAAHPLQEVGGGDAAYVLFTTGTTGPPKGVVVPQRAITRLVFGQRFVDFSAHAAVLHAAPIGFDASVFEIWGSLLNGAALVIAPEADFSAASLFQVITAHQVSLAWMTVGLFHVFCDYLEGQSLPLCHMIFGGDVASPDHVMRFRRAYPACRLSNGYGPTESCVFAAVYDVPAAYDGGPLPIGLAIAQTQVHILGDHAQPLPDGQTGEIALSGDGLALGYLGQNADAPSGFATLSLGGAARRVYRTGDWGQKDPDGTVHFLGRRDRQVKIMGKRVALDQLENFLSRQPMVAMAIVACAAGGTAPQICAWIKPARHMKGADEGFLAQLRGTLGASLPAHFMPQRLFIMRDFPLNRSGKVDRKALLAQLSAPPRAAVKPIGLAPSVHQQISVIWEETLDVHRPDPEVNFFDAGGTSLHVLILHAALERQFGLSVPLSDLFSHLTINGLSAYLAMLSKGMRPQAQHAPAGGLS